MLKRVNYIDRMKGFAILLVVIGHVYLFSMGQSICVMSKFISSFHMPLFMFLSGLVAASGIISPYWSYEKLFRKIWALIMPMLVFGVLFSLTFSIVNSLHDFICVVVNFINAPAKNGYWYLMSLSVFYVSLLLFRLNRWNHWIVDILIAGITFVVFFLGWKYTAQTRDPLCLLDCGNTYVAFVLGVFVSKYKLMNKMVNSNWMFAIGIIGYLLLFGYECPVHAVNSLLVHIIVPICAIVVVSTLFVRRENESSRIERVLEYVGKNTLDVYVLHYFLVTNINLSVADRWLQNSGNVILSVLMVGAISCVVIFVSIGVGKILHQSFVVNKVVFGKI